jgi:hypothetical protein
MGLVQYPVRSLCVCVCSRRAILLFDHWNSRHLFHILRISFISFTHEMWIMWHEPFQQSLTCRNVKSWGILSWLVLRESLLKRADISPSSNMLSGVRELIL